VQLKIEMAGQISVVEGCLGVNSLSPLSSPPLTAGQALIATVYVAHALGRMVLIPPAAAYLLDIFGKSGQPTSTKVVPGRESSTHYAYTDLSELRQHVPIIVQNSAHHHSFAPRDIRQALLTHSPITIQHIKAIHRDWPEAVIR
jgi:hypothetical protein